MEEGVTASSTCSAFVRSLSFCCWPRGKCELINLLEEGIRRTGCARGSRAEADPPGTGTLDFHLETGFGLDEFFASKSLRRYFMASWPTSDFLEAWGRS